MKQGRVSHKSHLTNPHLTWRYSSYAEVCVRLAVSQWPERWTHVSIVDYASILASVISLKHRVYLDGQDT